MSHFAARFLGTLLLFSLAPVQAQHFLAGTPRIEQSLDKLNQLGSVLMIAAHPDDENSPVVAYYSRARHMRTAYLSLTRGEGGQNLIGSEQGEALGVIRTQELLAARRVDGAEQFFARAIDFGFSKSPVESMEKWGHDQTLADVVWVIRRFRPDVLIMTFSGTPRDGHGMHQASAMLGREAFAAAADPTRFPEQLREVKIWQPRRAMQSLYIFSPEMQRAADGIKNRLTIDTGVFDPVLGRSASELAGLSRSQHRSQAMGFPERRGTAKSYLVPVAGEAPTNDIFDGIDTSWNRIAGGASVGAALADARRRFEPAHPERIVPLLAQARTLLEKLDDPLARIKLVELDETIALCAGLWIDAQAERAEVVPGSELGVTVNLLSRAPGEVKVEAMRLGGFWNEVLDPPAAPLPLNEVVKVAVHKPVPEATPYSQPYWLAAPREGDRYTVAKQSLIGLAGTPPALRAQIALRIAGARIELERPVEYRYVDRTQGERVRPLVVVPPVTVRLPERVLMFKDASPRQVEVAVKAVAAPAAGQLHLEIAPGWTVAPAAREFTIPLAGEQRELTFTITPPSGESRGQVRAVARIGTRDVSAGIETITYPHIPVQVIFPPSQGLLVRGNVHVTARKVGYIMGAGDLMPEAIRQLGCEVTLLTPADLEHGNLAGYDAIVAGVRAFHVRPDLAANQPRLLDYVRAGGTYIVQYQTLDSALPPLGPYPFTVTHDRVAVEDSPVTFTDADSLLLTRPNHITAGDFDGWVQERGLYFARDWDKRYSTAIAAHDPGEQPLAGGLLWTRLGKGVYIFTGYSFFRELPAGVTGAWRLFANLLSAK